MTRAKMKQLVVLGLAAGKVRVLVWKKDRFYIAQTIMRQAHVTKIRNISIVAQSGIMAAGRLVHVAPRLAVFTAQVLLAQHQSVAAIYRRGRGCRIHRVNMHLAKIAIIKNAYAIGITWF